MTDQNNSNNQNQNTQHSTSNKGLIAITIAVLTFVFIFTVVVSFRSDIITFLNEKYGLSINESDIEKFLSNKKTSIYQLTPIPKVPPTQPIIPESTPGPEINVVFSDTPVHSTEIFPEDDEQTIYQPAMPTITPTPVPTFPANTIATIKIGNESDIDVNPAKELPVFELCDASVGDIVFFGSYEQDNDLSNGPEPIAWYVLDQKDDNLLLLAVYILNDIRYNDEYTYTTWEKCTLRAWLNNDFYQTAFSDAERQIILLSDNENKANPYAEFSHDFENTQDYCFALSVDELHSLFNEQTWEEGSYYFGMGNTGKVDYRFFATMTPYAFAQGCSGYNYITNTAVKINGDPSEFSHEYDPCAQCDWWLRSLGSHLEGIYDTYRAALATAGGACVPTGWGVSNKEVSVRPAIWVRTK